jgi:GDPmannose 4,6-dehydratase
MQWMMLQQDTPQDFVIASGFQHSVRQFILWSAAELGLELTFQGHGVHEFAAIKSIQGESAPNVLVGDVILRIDPKYFRPSEVSSLLGDAAKAKTELGWQPEISAQEMCAEMVAQDLHDARRARLLIESGYVQSNSLEI